MKWQQQQPTGKLVTSLKMMVVRDGKRNSV